MVDSFAAPQHVIELPDDDEDVPLRPMGRRGRSSGRKAPKQPKIAAPKPRKTLPKIKINVHVALG